MNVDPEDGNDLDPDGTLSSEFSQACAQLGGNIEDWEDYWLEIQVPTSRLDEWVKQILPAIESGQYGPEAQKIAEVYSVTEIVDMEGEVIPYDLG